MISKNLIKSSFIYTVFGALPLIGAFILLLFYTEYLSKADFGALVLFISFTTFIQIIMTMGFDTYIIVNYFENKKNLDQYKSKVGLLIGYLLIWGLFVTFIVSIAGKEIFGIIFQNKGLFFFPYGLMSVITAFFNAMFKTYSNLLIRQERPIKYAIVNGANFIMTIGFSLGLLFYYPFSLVGPIWGRLLSGIGIFLIAIISFQLETGIRIKKDVELRKAFQFVAPLLLYSLITWGISNLNPYILKYFLSLEDVAIFGFALQLTLLIEFIFYGMNSAISPKVYGIITDQKLKASTPELNKYFSSLNALILIIVPIASLLLPLILPLFINRSYDSSYLFVSILNIGFAAWGLMSYFQTPIYLFRKTNLLPPIYLALAVIQIVLSVIFIKYFGIWGAAISNLITRMLQSLFLYLAARKIFKFEFNKTKFIYLPFLIILFIGIAEYFINLENMILIRLIEFIICYSLIFLFYRIEIRELITFIATKYGIKKA